MLQDATPRGPNPALRVAAPLPSLYRARPECEQLQDNEILCRTSPQPAPTGELEQAGSFHHFLFEWQPAERDVDGLQLEQAGSFHHFLFEWQPAERDVDGRAPRSGEQQHAVPVRKPRGVRHTSSLTRFQERSDKLIFPSEPAQQGHVHVTSKAGLAPAQQRDDSNDAELPLPLGEKSLKIARRLQYRRHRRASTARILANHACCSTKPEVAGGGGMSMGSSPVPKICRTASCVSENSISRRRTSSSSGPARRHVSTHRPQSSRGEFARGFRIYNLIVTK